MSKPLPAFAATNPLAGGGRLDYLTFLTRVGEVANRLSLERLAQARHTTAGGDGPATRPDVRPVRETPRHTARVRPLSAGARARVDLQLKMLDAIPAKARGAFVKELADHARQYPSSAHYLRNLADDGHDGARQILVRMGADG